MSQLNRPTLTTINYDRPRTSDGVKPLKPKRPAPGRYVSFNTAPMNNGESLPALEPLVWKKQDKWQRVDRHAQNVDPNIAPTPPSTSRPNVTPFVAFDESFSALLGANPSIKLLIHDPRAPFFYSGGAWIPRLSTLFLTSSLLRDTEPSAVVSASKRTEISKIEVYGSQDLSRDKVRCQGSYLAAGCAPFPSAASPGIVLCAQGTLRDPAGLVYVDARRPHKSHMLLNNFQGRPFNSPCDIATNVLDNCLYFTDPAYGYERGYRAKPQLPIGHVYRFDPSSGDCRVVANGMSRPGGLAFSPDYSVLYISDLGDKYSGTTVYAFDIMYTRTAFQPGPLALSSTARPETPNGHQKTASSSSTASSNDSAHYNLKDPPTASSHALAAAARIASPTSPSSTTNGHYINGNGISRSNSRDRARKVIDLAQNSSRQLRSMSSNLGINLKSSFNTTPALSQTILQNQHRQTQHLPVQPPSLRPPLTSSSSTFSGPPLAGDGPRVGDGPRLGAFLTNRRLFAYSPSTAPSGGISTDPIQGNVWLGTDEGVEVFSGSTGSMVGKVLASETEGEPPTMDRRSDGRKMKGVSRVAFGSDGEAWLLGGERLWRIGFEGGGWDG